MKITVKDLTKEIKGVRVLNGINLEMEDGYIYGLQGKRFWKDNVYEGCLRFHFANKRKHYDRWQSLGERYVFSGKCGYDD